MERMREYSLEPERPRVAEIEGKIETSFTEIDPSQMQPVPLRDITWGDTTLAFEEVGKDSIPVGIFGMEMPVILYTGQLGFIQDTGKKRKVDLTRTTTRKSVLFTGTRNGFYAYDLAFGGRNEPFYVVGLSPDELEANISRLSALYHELGHSLIFDGDLDTRIIQAAISLRAKDLPPVRKAQAYSGVISRGIPDHARSQLPTVTRTNMRRVEAQFRGANSGVSLFHERNAWAAGMSVVRAYDSPTGFNEPQSYFDYARLCLSSYGRHYRDEKFVNGWRK